MTRATCSLLVGAALGMAGCGQPTHLQYDHSRAYRTAMQVQADLSRPSVSDAAYALSGEEGLEVRQRVIEESTDAESNMAEFIQSFAVQ